jgi:hypothetical protein
VHGRPINAIGSRRDARVLTLTTSPLCAPVVIVMSSAM